MTQAKRKEYRNYLLIALAVLIIGRWLMKQFAFKMEQSGKTPLPIWQAVESAATVITGIVVVALLVILAGLIPVLAPVFYIAAIGIALYSLYYGFMRWGKSAGIVPDDLLNDDFYENLNNNTSIFTSRRDSVPAWLNPNYAYDA